uniref:Putative thyroglobulin type i repeat protein n=1 Tax=Ixodes scapularis TaxID=6945 RepID=A0A4D5RKZ0_IXOSC
MRSMAALVLALGTWILCCDVVSTSQGVSASDVMRVLFTKDVCERTFCLPVENCEKGFVLTSGCCPVCQAILTEDQTCWTMAVTFDGTPTGRCEEGLSCKQGICTRDEKQDHNSCEERRELRLQLKKENLIAEEAWVPTCDARGGYEAKQCKSNKCVCVDEKGAPIFGQAELSRAENMTCACSRQMTARKRQRRSDWMAGPQIHCDSRGNYEELQCEGELCYCADPMTGKPTGHLVLIQQISLLPCYDAERYAGGYLTICEREMTRVRSLVHQFSQKGQTLVGLEMNRCDIDGGYARVQCGRSESCACSNNQGVSLKSYAYEQKTGALKEMSCNCAIDEDYRIRGYAKLPSWTCDQYGNFRHVQWLLDRYYCLEEDGSVLQSFEKKKITKDEDIARQCALSDFDIYCQAEKFKNTTTCEDLFPSSLEAF